MRSSRKTLAVPHNSGDLPVSREMLAETFSILKLERFLRTNRRRVSYRLEKVADQVSVDNGSKREDRSLLMPRIRPLLDGIVCLGSSPKDHESARIWLEERVPDVESARILATSVLAHLGSDMVRRSRSPKRKKMAKFIMSQIDAELANMNRAF